MNGTAHGFFHSAGARWFAGATLLMLAALGRQPLEQTMARHMLLQMPMLAVAGVLLAQGVGHRFTTLVPRLRAWDENGLTGLTVFLLVSGFWMIPRALDLAVASLAVDAGKFASLLLAGWLLPGSLARANKVIQLFFLGNFAWMAAIVGMLYQDASSRLCNFYLIDDQATAGAGLVALAVALPLLWFIAHYRKLASGTAVSALPSTR
jgi:hypothetical protein